MLNIKIIYTKKNLSNKTFLKVLNWQNKIMIAKNLNNTKV